MKKFSLGAALLLLFAFASVVQAQTNLSLTATAADTGGGAQTTYGSDKMNDNSTATHQWISGSSTSGTAVWASLTWSSAQTIASIQIQVVGTTTRFLRGATVQYLSGTTWTTDSTYLQSAPYALTYTHNLAATRTTTAIRITNFQVEGTQASNPQIIEFRTYAPAGPNLTTSVSTLPLGNTVAGTAGTTQNFTVSGSTMSTATTITAPAGGRVELSLNQTTWDTTLTITSTGTWGPTTVYVRIPSTATAGAVSGNITVASTGATTRNVAVSGSVIELSATPNSLNCGSTGQGTPSTPVSYNLTGSNLSGNTVLTAPANFEIATASTGPFSGTLTFTTATLNQDIYVRLTGATQGTFNGNITNVNSGVTVYVALTGSVTPPNDLAFSRNGPAVAAMVDNDAQGTGGNGLVVLDFSFATNQAAWTVTSITFTESGSMDASTDVNFIGLYEDTSGGTAGVFDGPTVDLLATGTSGTVFSGANGDYVATLSNSAIPASTTRRFFLVVRLAGTASAGETLKVEISAAAATTGGVGNMNGVPTSAANNALTINPATLTATFNGPGAYTTVNNDAQGTGGLLVLDVTLAARNDSWTVTSLSLSETGTMDATADLNLLALYVDNGNGVWDGPGTDTLATAATATGFTANSYTATLAGGAGTFAMNESKRFFLVAGLAGTASPGETLRASLASIVQTSPTAGTTVGIPSVASSALVIDVATLTVLAGPANPALVTVEQSAANFTSMIGQFRFSASNADFTVSGLTLTVGGNGDWVNELSATNGVEIWQDDGNGSFDAGDTLRFAGAGSAGSVTCGFTANVTVAGGNSVDFWVVLNVLAAAGGSPSDTFSASINATTDIATVTTGNVLLGTPLPNTGTLHVVTYSFTNITPVASLPAGGNPITITGSGFALPVTLTINGVTCPGTAVVNAGGTQITGLTVPPGSGSGLAIVLTTNNLPPKTLPQTFNYQNVVNVGAGGGGGGGGGGGCAAETGAGATVILLALLAVATRRRKAANGK